MKRKIEKIEIVIYLNEKRETKIIFIRPEKIQDILNDRETLLSDFLTKIVWIKSVSKTREL